MPGCLSVFSYSLPNLMSQWFGWYLAIVRLFNKFITEILEDIYGVPDLGLSSNNRLA